jgi:hypothetical protein
LLLGLLMLAVKVISTQFMIASSLSQDMVNDYEQVVRNGNQSFVLTHAFNQPMVLSHQVSVLRGRRSPGCLRDRGSQERTALVVCSERRLPAD